MKHIYLFHSEHGENFIQFPMGQQLWLLQILSMTKKTILEIGANTFIGILKISVNVDFFSFDYAPSSLKQEWAKKVDNVIREGIFIGGSQVREFENLWAKYTNSKYALGVSNGLDGLILALRSIGIGEGDVVGVPAHTFIATWTAVISVGATPLGIDVDNQGLINLSILRNLSPTLSAVIPVHMHGSTVDMQEVHDICLNQDLSKPVKIIEDASQSHGALCSNGEKIGTFSDVAVYSLYPTKNLGALGDAGIITTNNQSIFEKISLLRNYGSMLDNKYEHTILGFNNRLDNIQASILTHNLEYLPAWNRHRQELADIYIEELGGDVEILQAHRSDSVRHHLCVLVERRNELRVFLKSRGISTEIHYPKVAGSEANKILGKDVRFVNAEKIANSVLSLPLSQWHSKNQIHHVINSIKEWYKK
jgi:dTDP-4-amino-4,6-dideoxygalactose transaminase